MSQASNFLQPNLPLTGKTILVTRAAGQSSQFIRLLQHQGATVLEVPTLTIEPPSSWQPLDQAIARLHHFDWLILTSANGVDYFFERLAFQGKDSTVLKPLKIAVVGQKTAACLEQKGRTADFIPPNFVADSLVATFPEAELQGLQLLFPRVETGGRDVLVQELTAKGAIVTEVPAYQSGCAKTMSLEVQQALLNGSVDIVTFASSKTVQCFWQLVQTITRDMDHPEATKQPLVPNAFSRSLLPPCIASIGPQTSATCRQQFGRVEVEAEEYTLEGLIQAIVQWVGKGADKVL